MKKAGLSCTLGSWEKVFPPSHWSRISGKDSDWILPSGWPGGMTSASLPLRGIKEAATSEPVGYDRSQLTLSR